MNGEAVLEVVGSGAGITVQDAGRAGWKRFGIPPGGAMDAESAAWANRLVGNEESVPVLELAFTGARFRVLRRSEFAITGADAEASHPRWKSFHAGEGEEMAFGPLRSGVWSYIAVHGGFAAPHWFGSASVNPRAGFGAPLTAGALLSRRNAERLAGVAARFVAEPERPQFDVTPVLPVWPGPEWDLFPAAVRDRFLAELWRISSQIDRTGYRLEGSGLAAGLPQIPSAPVAVGVIQVPEDGRPIVILRDGPTVGGYPRLAILDPSAVSRMTQCAPATQVRFRLIS